jgi:hypothetical protein
MTPRLIQAAGWPPAWRFRCALRTIAWDLANNAPPTLPNLAEPARAVVAAWQGTDPKALRDAERAFVAALFADLVRQDTTSPNWMTHAAVVRLPGRHGGAQ